jgi:hypothetical protein
MMRKSEVASVEGQQHDSGSHKAGSTRGKKQQQGALTSKSTNEQAKLSFHTAAADAAASRPPPHQPGPEKSEEEDELISTFDPAEKDAMQIELVYCGSTFSTRRILEMHEASCNYEEEGVGGNTDEVRVGARPAPAFPLGWPPGRGPTDEAPQQTSSQQQQEQRQHEKKRA